MGGVASASGLGASVFVANPLSSTAQAVYAGAVGYVFQVEIDATANTGEDVYVAFYNTLTPTVGTTDPRMLLPCKAGTRKTYTFKRGITAFTTACLVAAVREKGAMTGPNAPSGTVKVTVRFT